MYTPYNHTVYVRLTHFFIQKQKIVMRENPVDLNPTHVKEDKDSLKYSIVPVHTGIDGNNL